MLMKHWITWEDNYSKWIFKHFSNSQNNELVECERAARRDRDLLQQEVTFLRKVTSSVAAAAPSPQSSIPNSTSALTAAAAEYSKVYDKNLPFTQVPKFQSEEQPVELHSPDHKSHLHALANDRAFKNVVVAPGVTLLQMYQ